MGKILKESAKLETGNNQKTNLKVIARGNGTGQ
jgi:hypothetical protein